MASEGGGKHHTSSSDRKRRRAKYLPHNQKKAVITQGQQGFLITCVGGKERSSIQEMINVLDQGNGSANLLPTPPRSGISNKGGKKDPDAVICNQVMDKEATQSSSVDTSVYSGESEQSGDESEEHREDKNVKKQQKHQADSFVSGRNCNLGKIREESSRGGGIDELLTAEINELRNPNKARFVGVETGCHGIVFVCMRNKNGSGLASQSPMDLAEAIVRDAAASKKSRTRYSMRVLPVEVTCYASAAELTKAAEPVMARHFPTGQDCPSFKYAVVCEARANTKLNKMELIEAVAKLVPKPHSVDLKNPDKTILVQIVKTACAVGVVRNFKELAKYNLRQLTSQPQPQPQPPPEAK
ncbi:hypothetical protein CY35_14G055400 [Sphagnum magellanicum]|nr:hypothetical protein CY35_14G055400 [Sphagnum magellanicum]